MLKNKVLIINLKPEKMFKLGTYQKAVLTRVIAHILARLEKSELVKSKYTCYTALDLDKYDVNALKGVKNAINAKPVTSNYISTKVIRVVKFFDEYRVIVGIGAYDKYNKCLYHYFNIKGISFDESGVASRIKKLVDKENTRFVKKMFTDYYDLFESL